MLSREYVSNGIRGEAGRHAPCFRSTARLPPAKRSTADRRPYSRWYYKL